MGHNNLKWNISEEKGNEIAHTLLIEILNDQNKPMPLNELVFLLNNRSKQYKIHSNKKHNCFTKYLKTVHGGVVKFLDDFNIYGIIKNGNDIKVVLIRDLLEDFDIKSPLKRITRDNDWVIVE
tara:strand:- start:145 stop:513 length:369 start_codon:yes stop_codon:yes gene_type:complete